MGKLICKIYHSDIGAVEYLQVDGEEYVAAYKEELARMCEHMTEAQQAELDDLIMLKLAVVGCEKEACFEQGFTMGAKLMLELLMGEAYL